MSWEIGFSYMWQFSFECMSKIVLNLVQSELLNIRWERQLRKQGEIM